MELAAHPIDQHRDTRATASLAADGSIHGARAVWTTSNIANTRPVVFLAIMPKPKTPAVLPASDTIQIDHTMFASVSALLASTHDDVNGNAVITDAQHDTITLKNVTTAQLLAHQSDVHIV